MSSEVTTSGVPIGSGTGVVTANTSDCETAPGVSGVSGVGGVGRIVGVGVCVGADPQKERLRVDPSPTNAFDRGFRVWT